MFVHLTPPTLLARNCWCQSCFNSAHKQLGYQAGVVTGHHDHAQHGTWRCVYCGSPVFRHTPWYAALWQSLTSWVGWLGWDLRVAYYCSSLNSHPEDR